MMLRVVVSKNGLEVSIVVKTVYYNGNLLCNSKTRNNYIFLTYLMYCCWLFFEHLNLSHENGAEVGFGG